MNTLPKLARFGATAVPFTVSWTSEEKQFVGYCEFAGRRALCMPHSPGIGKPQFGKPHSNRQRQAITSGLCDLCGKPLMLRTKVSLSHARERMNAAGGGTGILQVEPLLHRECALESMKYCPSLKRDIAAGALMIRQVNQFRVQFAIMSPEYIAHVVPDYIPNPSDRIIGHAKGRADELARSRPRLALERPVRCAPHLFPYLAKPLFFLCLNSGAASGVLGSWTLDISDIF